LAIDHFGRLHPGIAEAAGMLGPNAIPTLEWSASRGGGPESRTKEADAMICPAM
jgi:hypothetical protein